MSLSKYFVVIWFSVFADKIIAGECKLEEPSEPVTVPGHVEPSQGASGEVPDTVLTKYKNPINEDYAASVFPITDIGRIEGTDVVYTGPSTPGTLFQGINRSYPNAQEVIINAKLHFSSAWAPSGREYCSKHKTKFNQARVCVERKIAYDPTYVTVQLVHGGNRVIYEKRFINLNNFSNTLMRFPVVTCAGGVENFDIRVKNFEGGTANFRIHRVNIFGTYR